jgi:PHD/YefM family antitoxin component YafN of YafNO toxin-antitoxin module
MSVMFLTDEMGNKKAVVLSIQEYEELEKKIASIEETSYLLRSPKNRDRLLNAISDIEMEKVEVHDIIPD